MKRDVYTIRLVCFVLCFIPFTFLGSESGNGSLFAQDSLKPPVIISAGKPRIIQIPKTAGGSYTIQTRTGSRTVKLEPPKVFTLPVVSRSLSNTDKKNESDQSSAAQG